MPTSRRSPTGASRRSSRPMGVMPRGSSRQEVVADQALGVGQEGGLGLGVEVEGGQVAALRPGQGGLDLQGVEGGLDRALGGVEAEEALERGVHEGALGRGDGLGLGMRSTAENRNARAQSLNDGHLRRGQGGGHREGHVAIGTWGV